MPGSSAPVTPPKPITSSNASSPAVSSPGMDLMQERAKRSIQNWHPVEAETPEAPVISAAGQGSEARE
eukprot:5216403-Alexandrium_andersonii.AAC.1